MFGSFKITSIRLYTPLRNTLHGLQVCTTWLRLFLHEPNKNGNQSVINHGLLMGGEQLQRDKLWVTEYRTIRAWSTMAYSWVESNWSVISCGLLSREQSEHDQLWVTDDDVQYFSLTLRYLYNTWMIFYVNLLRLCIIPEWFSSLWVFR